MNEEKSAESKKDDWVKCQSKSRPGQSYLFNKSTGESKWYQECSTSTDIPTEKMPCKALSNYAKTKTKTFAQDRLKRLQHRLRVETERTTAKELNKSKPKTKESKQRNVNVNVNEALNVLKNINPYNGTTLTSLKEDSSNVLLPEADLSKTRTKTKSASIKIRDVKAEEQPSTSAKANQLSKNDVIKHVSPTTTKRKKKRSADSAKDDDDEIITGKQRKVEEKTVIETTLTKFVEKRNNLNAKSTYKRKHVNGGSANARLERLRHSLQMQQYSSTNKESCADPNILNSSLNDDIEEMEWQPIVAPTTVDNDNSSLEPNTMGEYYDMVNENLMRLNADKKAYLNNKKWLKDKFYVIVDTNVLLDYLAFIKDLGDMKLCDTNGTIIYVPYCVLQELDKLKLRQNSEGTKTLVVRAIKFLNDNIERNESNILAQSALEERQYVINITSPDDSIINCCLQVNNHIDNVILLTEDVNLRNKALSNNILVSTKSDLLSRSKYSSHSS